MRLAAWCISWVGGHGSLKLAHQALHPLPIQHKTEIKKIYGAASQPDTKGPIFSIHWTINITKINKSMLYLLSREALFRMLGTLCPHAEKGHVADVSELVLLIARRKKS